MDYSFWGPFGLGFIIGAAIMVIILVALFFIKNDDLDDVAQADGDTEPSVRSLNDKTPDSGGQE